MKLNKAAVTAVIAALAVMIAFSAYMILHSDDQEKKKYVSVIVENSGDNRWTAFIQGLNQAAQDDHIVLNVVSTGTFATVEAEANVAVREIENGADGIIIQPVSDDAEGILADALSSTQSVLVCTDVAGEKMQDCIATDGFHTGQMIAEAVKAKENITEETLVGLLSGNQALPVVQECLKGFKETLGLKSEQIRWDLNQSGLLASPNMLSLSMAVKPVDILISLDNNATEAAVDYLTGHPGVSCRVYGEGRSEKCIYNVDSGVITALAVPDEYTMGYESLERLNQKMTYFNSQQKAEDIGTLMVTKENLHDQDTAWIVFPTVY